MGVRSWAADDFGQATVELAVAFPVALTVAVIAVNAMLFFSDCASFDRASREMVRIHAASPAYGQQIEQSKAKIEDGLGSLFSRANLSTRVSVESVDGGHVRFNTTLEYSPTLFGLGLRSSVMGISLPHLEHTEQFTVDCYKPGMLL